MPSDENNKQLFENLLKVARQYLEGKNYQPLTRDELIRKLAITPQNKKLFGRVLRQLQKDGDLTKVEGRYYPPEAPYEAITGTLHMHPRGFGFLQADHPALFPQDIFIPKNLTQNAVHGDRVEVLIDSQNFSDKGPEGRVIAILERSRTHLAGTICEFNPRQQLINAYVPILGATQDVVVEPSEDFDLKIGDRVVLEVIDWGGSGKSIYSRVTHFIGHMDDPSKDIPAAIEEFGLTSEFRLKVKREAKRFGMRVSQSDIKEREDLRSTTCVTIDPETAKDFDDAISLTKDKKGNYHLSVHIADVSHYVHPGSSLDEAAQGRCNSTYFPGTCIPMLPKELSENLCSLKPKVNRLAASVIMKLSPSGKLLDYRMARTVIKSARRFSYGEAREIIQGKRRSVHKPLILLMAELCAILKERRRKRGSVELDVPEFIINVNKQGVPTGFRWEQYDETHQMIEEFMLMANEVVATHLSEENQLIAYRVHEPPDQDNLRDFSRLAATFGFHIPAIPEPEDIQKLFADAKGSPYYDYLSTCYIRSMRMATYSPDNVGHYGLSMTHYCHFTSPIRRYVDILVHRVLFGEPMPEDELQLHARNCSEQERLSARAENSVRLLKKMRLLLAMKKKEPMKVYDGLITRVKPFGFYFELVGMQVEGFIHISKIGQDYYMFDESHNRLIGRRTGETIRPGDEIQAMLLDVDLIRHESFWDLVHQEKEEEIRPKRRERKKKRRKY